MEGASEKDHILIILWIKISKNKKGVVSMSIFRPKLEKTEPKEFVEQEDREIILNKVIEDYTTRKQVALMEMKRGIWDKELFLKDAYKHILTYYVTSPEEAEVILLLFEQYIFGYSKLSSLIDDPEITDIRCVSHNNIRIKKTGKRTMANVSFSTQEEYEKFVKFTAIKNQVNISNMNAIQSFTDINSHKDFILRFTLTMPVVNTFEVPYLSIRKIAKNFPEMKDLIKVGMLDRNLAEELVLRFRKGSTLICGGNSSGKTTILNALKETLPDDISVLVAQQADELTSKKHPDMMFLHSIPKAGESHTSYDLKKISIAGLTMDVDFFIIGEIKGEEAMYLLNASYTGQICAATVHAPDAEKGVNKIVDYAMYASKYNRNELLKMMECFQTVIFMKDYKVQQVVELKGWDRDSKEIMYQLVYERKEE